MSTTSVDDASVEDLRDFAITTCGLDLRANASRSTVIAALSDAQIDVSQGIPVSSTASSNPGLGKRESMPKEIASTDRVQVLIAKEKGAIDPVPVSVNGFTISIRRGERVSIPRPHLEVLQNSLEHDYPTDENGKIIGDPSEVSRFPLQVWA